MSFTVSVQDSSFPAWDNDTTAYLPISHYFNEPHPDQSIRLIDVIEAWKGLRPAQACELRFWHNALRQAVERYIHDVLVGNMDMHGLKAHADDIHHYVGGLQHQQISVDIDRILEDTIGQQKKSHKHLDFTWLAWDKKVALVNLLRLCHCFWDDVPELHVYFYSELLEHGSVQVYAEVMHRPPMFYFDQAKNTYTFRSPVLDPGKGLYAVVVDQATRTVDDVWELRVSTLFRECRFERVFRFREEVQAPNPIPRPIEKPGRYAVKQRKSRKKIREISANSVRVQGTAPTDFELAARDNHPDLYTAHHDHLLGKHDILGKLYGSRRMPSPQRTQTNIVSIRENYNHIRPHLDDVSFRPPSPPSSPSPILDAMRTRDDSDPLPELPPARVYSSDKSDSLYGFSPVKVRSGMLSSPLRSSSAKARRKHDAQKMFASSPTRITALSSPMRPLMRASSPFQSYPDSPARSMRNSSPRPHPHTAIWMGSDSDSDESFMCRGVITAHQLWKLPRKRVAKGKGKEKRGDEVAIQVSHGSEGSLGTVEITPPQSSSSSEVRGG